LTVLLRAFAQGQLRQACPPNWFRLAADLEEGRRITLGGFHTPLGRKRATQGNNPAALHRFAAMNRQALFRYRIS